MVCKELKNRKVKVSRLTFWGICIIGMLCCGKVSLAEELTSEDVTYKVLDEEADTIEITGVSTSGEEKAKTDGSLTVPATIDGYQVVGLGEQAFLTFALQGSLTSVTISEGVEYIGSYTFANLPKLTEVNLPSTLQSIGYGCFASCTSLTTIELPENMKELGEACFRQSAIATIDIPDSIETIGADCFRTTPLKTITLPEKSTLTLGARAFYNCDELLSITLPEGITELGESTFFGCDNLTSVRLSEGITTIGAKCFQACNGLHAIDLPSSLTTIGIQAFYYCKNLDSVKIPENVKEFGGAAFWGTKWFQAQREKSENKFVIVNNIVIDGRLCSGDIQIPDGIEGIGEDAFYGSEDSWSMSNDEMTGAPITSISFPESCTRIGFMAFYKCSQLTTVDFSDSMKEIESKAFDSCTSLTSVVLPANLEVLGKKAFVACGNIKVTVPDTLPNLENIHFEEMPDAIFQIQKNGKVYEYLTKNNIEITYETYGGSDVEEDTKTEGETQDKSTEEQKQSTTEEKVVYKVGNTYTVKKLKYKILSKNKVTFVGATNKEIKSLTIPATVKLGTKTYKVTSISKKACKGYKKLQKVVVGNNVSKIGDEAFMNCKVLKTVTLGKGITEIGKKSFYKDTKIKKLNIKSKKLKKVGKYAFYKIKGMTVEVPKHKNNKYKKDYHKLIMRRYVLGYTPKAK